MNTTDGGFLTGHEQLDMIIILLGLILMAVVWRRR